jgi:hypothetical protein
MRAAHLIASLALLTAVGTAPADDMRTATSVILCASPENVDTANIDEIAKSRLVLSAMGCVRFDAGTRFSLVAGGADASEPWLVRLYLGNADGSMLLWGLPSSLGAGERESRAVKSAS